MKRLAEALLCAALALAGCATTRASSRPASPVERVLAAARGQVGATSFRFGGPQDRQDCSGFVQGAFLTVDAALTAPGVRGESGTEVIYRTAAARGQVRGGVDLRAGDLLFFHQTYDRNGNGRRDDRFTHVALVEARSGPRAVSLLHFASGVVRRDVMDLSRPAVGVDPHTGQTVNSTLRRGSGRRLTSQLFFQSARPLSR